MSPDEVREMVVQCEKLLASVPERSQSHDTLTQFILPGLRHVAESLEPVKPLDCVYDFGNAIKIDIKIKPGPSRDHWRCMLQKWMQESKVKYDSDGDVTGRAPWSLRLYFDDLQEANRVVAWLRESGASPRFEEQT
jgi:hypothetical protein